MYKIFKLLTNDVGNVFFKMLLCLLLVNVATPAYAQLEIYGKFKARGAFEPVINYNGTKVINEKFSITYFGLIRKTWGAGTNQLSLFTNENYHFFCGHGDGTWI